MKPGHSIPLKAWSSALALVLALASLPTMVFGEHNLAAVPGGIYQWSLPEGADDVRFDGNPVLTFQNHAFVGISVRTKPGQHTLTYQHENNTKKHSFNVSDKAYSEQHITLENEDMVTPPEETLARIRKESARQKALYLSFSSSPKLHQGFIQPVEGIVTSLFGHKRFFNGKARNPHSGLDIAADTGTPIAAASKGVVVLADHLYFNGNTVFLDHGQGLITMYCHMSKILVEEGSVVNQQDIIGLVGATGRVTGPHLHWSVSLNGTRVDPQLFTSLINSAVK